MTQKYEATWQSLKQYTVPEWYVNAKFGIFIHWGAYSVPGFASEWYSRNMYQQGSPEFEFHVKTFGPHTEFGYKDFVPLFTMENYDPAAWAELFQQSGARYVMPVAEHHDGFAMYDTDFSEWCAAKKGPNRDVMGDLAAAVRARDMVFGVSYHRAENWWFLDGGTKFDSDVTDPRYADFYGPPVASSPVQGTPEWKHLDWRPRPDAKFLDNWLARTCEIIDKYQPQVFWFDWWIEQAAFEPYLQKFAAYYYNQAQNWDLGAAINFKNEAFPAEAAVFDVERGQLPGINPFFWQTDTSVSKNSWGYVHQRDYKTPYQLITDLVDIVSKNGCLLLNIGPKPDGTIPEEEQAILRDIGAWLQVNGEAIYDTRPWCTFGEGPTKIDTGSFSDNDRQAFTAQDFRFTTRDNVLYVMCLNWPQESAIITKLTPSATGDMGEIAKIEMLGSGEKLAWTQAVEGLKITCPAQKPCDHAYTFKITFKA